MTNRLALIVDDSRSARHILSRMLESFGLEVASVESAELALTYLQTARPDVIFMDHLMPGMDGFAAVRVLKANPDTVTIPVLMYTSQEGEMYLSQARALGAMGVLPKTLKHADVAAALQQLNLLPSAKVGADQPAVAPTLQPRAPAPAAAKSAEVASAPALRRDEVISTHPDTLPQLAHRIAAEVRDQLQQVAAQATRRVSVWRAVAALSGVAGVILLGWLLVLQGQMRRQLADLQTAQTQMQSLLQLAAPAAAQVAPAITEGAVIASESLPVAYGEVPLAGARLELLRELQARYADDPRKLVIHIESSAGDFCLDRNDAGSHEPAADDALVTSCEQIGNPFSDGLGEQQRQSVAFANLLASFDNSLSSTLSVQLADNGHKPLSVYPVHSATLTAGEWNRVAERNQQVSFTVRTVP